MRAQEHPRRTLAVSIATAAVLCTGLYLCVAQLDRWAARSFAEAKLAAMLVAVLQVGLVVCWLCLAPALSRVFGRVLCLPRGVSRPVPFLRFCLAGTTAATIVYAADLVAWLATARPEGNWLAGLVGACIAAVLGLGAGAVSGLLVWLGTRAGPAAAWRIFPLASAASPIVAAAGLAVAAVPLASAVPLRVRFLGQAGPRPGQALVPLDPALCALIDCAALAVATLLFVAAARLASRWLRVRSPGWRAVGVALCVGALALCAFAGVRRPALSPSGLLDVAHLGSFSLLGIGMFLALPIKPRIATRIVPAALLLGLGGLVGVERAPGLFGGAPTEVVLSRWMLTEMVTRVDLDGDGFAYFFGDDCDDLDFERRPDAPEVPGNGIDDNCRGGDRRASVPWRPRPSFVSLPASVAAPKRILLLSVDALRADRLGVYGYPKGTSPNIDRLARNSVVFRRAYSSSPLTRFAFPMLFTGRLLSEIQWNHELYPPGMTPQNRTVAEILAEAGFRTAVFQTVYPLGQRWGIPQGFQHNDESLASASSHRARHADALVDGALRWIEAHRDERSFVWIHFFDPHAPYSLHDGIRDFGPGDSGRYDGEVSFTDREIGRLLDRFRELDMVGDTAVILVADHGEMLGEHGATRHGGALVWEEVLRVPLIVHVPGILPREVHCVTEHRDLASTILNLGAIDGAREGLIPPPRI